jgi:hypothetical protein
MPSSKGKYFVAICDLDVFIPMSPLHPPASLNVCIRPRQANRDACAVDRQDSILRSALFNRMGDHRDIKGLGLSFLKSQVPPTEDPWLTDRRKGTSYPLIYKMRTPRGHIQVTPPPLHERTPATGKQQFRGVWKHRIRRGSSHQLPDSQSPCGETEARMQPLQVR